MPQDELKEKIYEIVRMGICDLCDHWASDTMSKDTREDIQGSVADQILALIKEALPELAKAAGYVKLAKDQNLPLLTMEEYNEAMRFEGIGECDDTDEFQDIILPKLKAQRDLIKKHLEG